MSLVVLALLVLLASVVLGVLVHPLWMLLLLVGLALLWTGIQRGRPRRSSSPL